MLKIIAVILATALCSAAVTYACFAAYTDCKLALLQESAYEHLGFKRSPKNHGLTIGPTNDPSPINVDKIRLLTDVLATDCSVRAIKLPPSAMTDEGLRMFVDLSHLDHIWLSSDATISKSALADLITGRFNSGYPLKLLSIPRENFSQDDADFLDGLCNTSVILN